MPAGYNTQDGFTQGGTLFTGGTVNSIRSGTTTLLGGSAVVATGLGTVWSVVATPHLAGTATLGAAPIAVQGTIQSSGTVTLFAYLANGTLASSATVVASYAAFGG